MEYLLALELEPRNLGISSQHNFYLTIRLRAGVVYEQIVNEAQPSRLSHVENEGK